LLFSQEVDYTVVNPILSPILGPKLGAVNPQRGVDYTVANPTLGVVNPQRRVLTTP